MFKAFGREVYDVGAFGNGSKIKYVANLLVAINNVASAEAMVLGMKAGLPPQLIFDLITPGAGNSRVFELRVPMMVKGDYDDATMKIDVWDKDMQVIGDYARKIKVPTPMFNATKPVYIKAMKSGLGALRTPPRSALCWRRWPSSSARSADAFSAHSGRASGESGVDEFSVGTHSALGPALARGRPE